MRQREPRVRDRDYLGWIKRLPCLACAARGQHNVGLHIEAAHCKIAIAGHGWREAGLSEKSHDYRCLPLCGGHHRGPYGEHMSGQRKFWDKLGICPGCACEALRSAYEAGEAGLEVIWDMARKRGPCPES